MHPSAKLFGNFCLVISVLSNALAAPSESNPAITQLLAVTGLAKEVQDFPKQLLEVISEDSKIQSLSPEKRTSVQSSFVRAFSSATLLDAITQTLQQNYDEASFRQFIQLYRQPLTMKIHALEDEAKSEQAFEPMKAYLAAMPSHPAAPARLALLQKLDQVTHDSSATVNLQIAIARAMAGTVAMSQPQELRPGPEQLKAYLANLTAQLRSSLEPAVTTNTQQSYLYAYRDVSNAELEQYINSYDDTAIQLCLNLIEQGLQTAFEEASAAVIRDSTEAASKKPESRI